MGPVNLPLFTAIIVISVKFSAAAFQSSTIIRANLSSTPVSLVCQNNGTLLTGNSSVCECVPPWSGDSCTEVNCVNGLPVGRHYDENSIFFNRRCICDSGFTGDLCDTSLVNPCGSHGRLIENKCACDGNYTGSKCEAVKYCLHGQLGSGRCSCHYGWSSDFCDTILCHQGFSDKTNSNCTCRSGYRGKFCDFCAEEDTSPYPECVKINSSNVHFSKLFMIVTGFMITVICLSCLIFVLFCWRRNNEFRRRYAPTGDDFGKRMNLMQRDDDEFLS